MTKVLGKNTFPGALLLCLIFFTPAFAQFDMQQIAVIQGARDTLRFGSSLAGVGDINKDGFEDLAVGQHGSNTFIYFGSMNFDTTADMTFPFFAWHIGHGDINGDSIPDLLLTPIGTIYIYYGGASFDNIPDDSIVNNATYFGWNFACGDINGDGYDDIAVWGDYDKVFVYLGGKKLSDQPAYILQGPPNCFGLEGLAIGDINGDGYKDIGASSCNDINDSTYIYFGGSQLDTVPELKVRGGVILGDLNGDDYADVITINGTYFGGVVIDSVVDSGIYSLGCSPAYTWTAVGEFNKDDYEDLFKGSGSIGGGDAYIYLGDNPLDTIVDWHYRDYEVGSYGSRVGVADLNGDGVDEAIVGDPGWWYNNPSYPPGRVYVYKNPYTAVEEEKDQLPNGFSLRQNFPNPFNSSTIIPFTLKTQNSIFKGDIHSTLVIFNILGQKIRTLVNDERMPGSYRVVWNGKDDNGKEVSSGIYFYQLKAGQFSDCKKLLLIK
jgi:hypothetical protein